MGKKFDDIELRQILEKIEKGEPLGTREKIYGSIVQVLRMSKHKKIVPRSGFKEDLKRNLLNQYDEIYSKKPWFSQIFSFWNSPFLRYGVSFCFVLFVGIGIYGSLFEISRDSSVKNFGQSAILDNSTSKSSLQSFEESSSLKLSSKVSKQSSAPSINTLPKTSAGFDKKESLLGTNESAITDADTVANNSIKVSSTIILIFGGILSILFVGYFFFRKSRKK